MTSAASVALGVDEPTDGARLRVLRFAAALKQAREVDWTRLHGGRLSLEELGSRTGIGMSTLSRWERADIGDVPTPEVIATVEEHLGIEDGRLRGAAGWAVPLVEERVAKAVDRALRKLRALIVSELVEELSDGEN